MSSLHDHGLEDDEDDFRAIDSDSSDEEDNALERRRRRKHENTYGVFWEEEEEPNDRTRRKKLRFRGDHSKPGTSEREPMFVRGSKPDATAAEPESNTSKKPNIPGTQEDHDGPSSSGASLSDDEDDPEEEQRKRKANEHFLSLLAKGRDKKARQKTSYEARSVAQSAYQQQEASSHENKGATSYGLGYKDHPFKEIHQEESASSGLGFNAQSSEHRPVEHQETDGLGFSGKLGVELKSLPHSFGRQMAPSKVEKPDPNIGKWEKHEKGIGSKLLAKMGYKGSGGLRAGSIASPINVKLRPANLGLGFGSFKEAASKKVKAPVAEETEASSASIGQISAIPTAKDVLKQATKRKRKKGAQTPTFVPYSEVLKKSRESNGSMQIIDMTGGSMDKNSSDKGEVALAEELLYNISFLLSTYENRLQSASTFQQSFQRQHGSFQNDIESLQNQATMLSDREAKLLQVKELLDGIESSIQSVAPFSARIYKTQAVIEKISTLFSDEDLKGLRFFETLVPAVLGTVVQSELDLWLPTSPLPDETTVRLLLLQNKEEALWDEVRKVLLTQYVVPHMKQKFFSSRWDPMKDSQARLDLVELFRNILKETIGNDEKALNEESVLYGEKGTNRSTLLYLFEDLLIGECISERLVEAVRRWKPGDCERLDLWVLPWLPLLSQGSIPDLVMECKRQLKASISFLNRTVSGNCRFVERTRETLAPWAGVLKPRTLQNMVKEVVTPRLARLLAQFQFSPSSKDDTLVGLPFDLHECELIDDKTLLSLLEGELLPRMAKCSIGWNKKEKAMKYCSWKVLMFSSKTKNLLKVDDGICRGLYALLLAEQFTSTSYHAVFTRRKLQAQEKNDEEWIRQEDKTETVEARVKLASQNATFREVVEEFAREHDLLLIPHRSKRVDGKQVFHFGKVPIYLDGNVAYSSINGGHWEATSLREIAKIATSLAE